MYSSSRRELTVQAAAALALSRIVPSATAESRQAEPARPLRVVCVGAHPDDPESGCGGTLARYAQNGHQVTIVYLTRGEAGIPGKSHQEAAAIRTAEAGAACKILGAKPVFAGQIDGDTEVNQRRTDALIAIVTEAAPDILLTHWPVDTHPDHQAASLLAFRAFRAARSQCSLYFFEVNSGSQTIAFTPTVYVDITSVRERKKQALFAHRSQDGEAIFRQHHEIMENFRGREAGVPAAEAFVSLARNTAKASLPRLN
jgi:LmbE family N-acetylglucosaminyl deacetylase